MDFEVWKKLLRVVCVSLLRGRGWLLSLWASGVGGYVDERFLMRTFFYRYAKGRVACASWIGRGRGECCPGLARRFGLYLRLSRSDAPLPPPESRITPTSYSPKPNAKGVVRWRVGDAAVAHHGVLHRSFFRTDARTCHPLAALWTFLLGMSGSSSTVAVFRA